MITLGEKSITEWQPRDCRIQDRQRIRWRDEIGTSARAGETTLTSDRAHFLHPHYINFLIFIIMLRRQRTGECQEEQWSGDGCLG